MDSVLSAGTMRTERRSCLPSFSDFWRLPFRIRPRLRWSCFSTCRPIRPLARPRRPGSGFSRIIESKSSAGMGAHQRGLPPSRRRSMGCHRSRRPRRGRSCPFGSMAGRSHPVVGSGQPGDTLEDEERGYSHFKWTAKTTKNGSHDFVPDWGYLLRSPMGPRGGAHLDCCRAPTMGKHQERSSKWRTRVKAHQILLFSALVFFCHRLGLAQEFPIGAWFPGLFNNQSAQFAARLDQVVDANFNTIHAALEGRNDASVNGVFLDLAHQRGLNVQLYNWNMPPTWRTRTRTYWTKTVEAENRRFTHPVGTQDGDAWHANTADHTPGLLLDTPAEGRGIFLRYRNRN